jgi:hypothetical protein
LGLAYYLLAVVVHQTFACFTVVVCWNNNRLLSWYHDEDQQRESAEDILGDKRENSAAVNYKCSLLKYKIGESRRRTGWLMRCILFATRSTTTTTIIF